MKTGGSVEQWVSTVQADLRGLEEQVDGLADRVEELERTLDAALSAYRAMGSAFTALLESLTGKKVDVDFGSRRRRPRLRRVK